jgi:uncharacterized protein
MKHVRKYSLKSLIFFAESPFITWADEMYRLNKIDAQPCYDDDNKKILARYAQQHEKRVKDNFFSQYTNYIDISGEEPDTEYTRDACHKGYDIIYKPYLECFIDSDIIIKKRSTFMMKYTDDYGSVGYAPVCVKLAKKYKPTYELELCCYADMIESLTGVRPEKGYIVSGDMVMKEWHIPDYYAQYEKVKSDFIHALHSCDIDNPPAITNPQWCAHWSSYAQECVEKNDHLRLVAGIRTSQISKLEQVGIYTLKDLALTSYKNIPRLKKKTFDNLKMQALMQYKTKKEQRDRPAYMVRTYGKHERKGLALLPEESPYDVWFDIEGYPYASGGLEYLLGVSCYDHGVYTFKDWWAHTKEQEKESFSSFMKWVLCRYNTDKSMHIYHYACYEITALKRLAKTYNRYQDQLQELIDQGVFVDLYKVVYQGLYVGEPRYSLKNIERLYASQRSADVSNALDSIIHYHEWRVSSESELYTKSPILKAIRDYNEDDCKSTHDLYMFLKNEQRKHNIFYRPSF